MAGRSRSKLNALQEKASSLLAGGDDVEEAARKLGVSPRTVRRWRQRKAEASPGASDTATVRRRRKGMEEMLRAEGPAVARVLLDLAKGGDVRAAALVVRLLGNILGSAGESDDADSEEGLLEIERELSSLPAAIASEIVGLLAQAESGSPGEPAGHDAASGHRERRCLRLPWQEEDHPPDEGPDSV